MGELKRSWREALGLGLLLAWMYCSFFSCGLIPHPSVLRSSEHVWVFVGIGMAASAIVLIALRRRIAFTGKIATGIVAAALGGAGSLLIWISFLGRTWDVSLSATGGILAGFSLSIMAAVWCQRMSGFKVSKLESAVPMGFIVAFALYFLLLAIKGPLFAAACALMPIGSMVLAFRKADIWTCPFINECACSSSKPIAGRIGPQLKSMAPLLAIYFLFWVQFSSFRVISSPNVVGDRVMHYLAPFSCAAVVAVVLFFLCLRHIRFLNYSLMYRWSIPLMVLGCGIFAMGSNPLYDFRSVAYAANFLAMFGAQFTIWVITPKDVCRMGFNPVVAMAGFMIAEGLGIACGLAFSLPAIGHEENLAGVSTLVTGAAALAAMTLGFNPEWFSIEKAKNALFLQKEEADLPATAARAAEKTRNEEDHGIEFANDGKLVLKSEGNTTANSSADDPIGSAQQCNGPAFAALSISDMFEFQARTLQHEFGLTERETEICALLLAGRSRPFIRDELIISLNTVHAHARNIFAKCGVHSQQELMSLLEREAKTRKTACMEN